MGNNPSTSKQGTPTPSASGHSQGHDSPRRHQQSQSQSSQSSRNRDHHQKGTSAARPPISVNNHRAAVPAQASLAQAHGSTDIKNSQALPITSLAASPAGSTKSATTAGAASSAKPLESKPVPVPAAKDKPIPDAEPTKPVDVPARDTAAATAQLEPTSPVSPFDASEGIHTQGSISDMSFIARPPRMPLPIEEEVHTPGSPITAPADVGDSLGEPVEALNLSEGDGDIVRKSSNLSTTTVDEDDAEELRVDKTRPTVPTRLEWLRGGERVYVTGTIFQWNRKQRLHPVEGCPGVFSTTINILPGTHHIRFLVDNNMQTSPDLPTTVDFGNNLVNYIEVSPDDVPATPQDAARTPQEREDKQLAESEEEKIRQRKDKQVLPVEAFSRVYPQYLLDYDNEPEDSPISQAAAAAIEKLPTPPSLPGFLSKPILNAATLLKDDNSVLNMPNHTTLNHLATSSIKNGTLAVSATTRYRDKYVTTIMYKPVPGHE
ncbi:snf1 kinase complex beta-subunit [Diaporthe amygdali]|uniref:snf1 kinase complex beta-subunit n=1 Tax=Phomopsis amygdali TaxID=1214568 RepID=UPI0022FE4B56|nr:snf1 kinase complex beta-subunit [Diaporthe amygdali]KAJ0117638.1 snf1 kinase complex beta-subunit [Diaporthe amygdali]